MAWRRPTLVSTMMLLAACATMGAARNVRAYCRTTTQFMQTDPEVCPPVMGVPLAWASACASSSINSTLLPPGISRDELRTEVDNAAERWATAPCPGGGIPSFHFVDYPDCDDPPGWSPTGRNANTVAFLDTWGEDANHPPEAIAVTITTFDSVSGEIRDADTELNLMDDNNPNGFTFTTGPPVPLSADLPTILTHELGHAQGLAHASDRSAVMWYRAGLGEQRRMLTLDDIAGICSIYDPSRVASCNPEPHGGFECAPGCQCNTPAPAAPVRDRVPRTVVATLACVALVRRRRAIATRSG
jgi:hypothetical protein